MIATDVFAGSAVPTRRITVVLIAAALAYPILLRLLFLFAGHVPAATPFAQAPMMALAFVLPFVVPGAGVVVLLAMRGREGMDACRIRRLALLAVAAPPLFTATGVVTSLAGIGAWDHLVWWLLWIASMPLWLQGRQGDGAPPRAPAVLRIGHGIAAVLVLLGYVGMHLANHLAAWWGADAHRAVQLVLRAWYRDPRVEVSLVVLLAWLIGSGVAMLRIYSRRPDMDGYRIFQVALGANVGAFMLSHVIAALGLARGALGIETDWHWAAGGDAGLLGDPWNVRLIPHYFLAVLGLLGHVGLGARIVALRHGATQRAGRLIVIASGVVGLLLALALTAALLGARL